MHEHEGDEQGGEEGEEGDDAPVAPGVGAAAPLQGEEEAGDAGEEEEFAEEVEFGELLFDGEAFVAGDGGFEEEGDNDYYDGADGEVDVEAPAPGDIGGEYAACEMFGGVTKMCWDFNLPSRGPTTDAIPNTAPKRPIHFGRDLSGVTLTRRTTAPVIMPAAPIPAIARPKIKAMELGAAPQIALPISKMPMMMRKMYLGV